MENTEKDESKLLCKLKRDRTSIIKEVASLIREDVDDNKFMMNILVKVNKEISANDEEREFAIKEASLNVTDDEILDLKDNILDQIELNSQK